LPPDRTEDLVAWLKGRASKVTHRSESERERAFDDIAWSIGKNYEHLKGLVNQLSFSAREGRKVSVGLGKEKQHAADAARNCAAMLHDYAFLTQHYYNKKTRALHLTASQTPADMQAFFTGGWFERFVWMTVLNALPADRTAAVRNVTLALPTSGETEIDIVAAVDGQPLLIECKTGEYQSRIQRYVDRSAELGVPQDRNLLVVLDLEPKVATRLSHIFALRVLDHQGVTDVLKSLVPRT
jgi:hypothetical protein